MGERNMLKDELPSASLQICLFHVLRTFKREVTCEKLKISVDERLHMLKILQKIAYCKSDQAYQELYKELQDANILQWKLASNKEQWVEGFKIQSSNFMNRTNNNRVESTKQKLKSVITKIFGFFVILIKTLLSPTHDLF